MEYRLALACVAQLIASTALLMWAALTHGAVPRWAAAADVALAFALGASGLWLRMRTEHSRSQAVPLVYPFLTTLPSVVIAGVWWWRDQLDLNILLPGLAWRMFILLELMPAAVAAVRLKAACDTHLSSPQTTANHGDGSASNRSTIECDRASRR